MLFQRTAGGSRLVYLSVSPSLVEVILRVTKLSMEKRDDVCKTEEKLLERLDQAILEVIDQPEKTQQTTATGTLFWQTLYH